MCTKHYSHEDNWTEIAECREALKVQEDLEKANDYYQEIVNILYSDEKQDFCILEHCLLELAEILNVRFPNNKNLNVVTKC